MRMRKKSIHTAVILLICLITSLAGCAPDTGVSGSVPETPLGDLDQSTPAPTRTPLLTTEPTPEPTSELTTQPASQPASQPTPEPTSQPAPAPALTPIPEPAPTPIPTYEYEGVVPHIFFHCLIAFPQITYSPGIGGALDTDCVTATEFKRCLEALYKNNYVLIDINSTFEVIEENGKEFVKDRKVTVPAGKIPIVMSIDDMVYDPNKMGWGMVDKIVLDASGSFATYTKHKNGEEVVSYDNEVIPILERFVRDHPDFSYNGARATLAVTGFAGILGYRIQRGSPNRQEEIDAVKPIVAKLKETGWNFACHGYGHKHSRDVSYSKFASDTRIWMEDIEPVTGPTEIYVYPYGQTIPRNDPKYRVMLDNGFKIICGVNTAPAWKNYGNSVFMGRQCIDGFSLRRYKTSLAPYLNIGEIIDLETRRK